jgi:hypothetical protein
MSRDRVAYFGCGNFDPTFDPNEFENLSMYDTVEIAACKWIKNEGRKFLG